jgi:hypothetical protein
MSENNAGGQGHTHEWVKTERLLAAAGVPYDVQQVKCAECGKVREQETRRLVA